MIVYVISAADGHSTIYDMLEGKFLTNKISNAYKNWQLFTPIVQVSFGINRVVESEVPVETWPVSGSSPAEGFPRLANRVNGLFSISARKRKPGLNRSSFPIR